jgi:flagellar hook-associated protein 3 FlgL
MQNNALSNINRNKIYQDDLNNQLATGKRINRPSDDPVVAIRALRLRTDVSQINQYYEKNIPDAQHWLSLTETSIKTTISVIKDIVEQCEKGSSDTLQVSDRNKIIDNLKALRDEIYATGDADYAGRYIFTGYRTDTSLSFGKDVKQKEYSITESFDINDLEKMSYIDSKALPDIAATASASLTVPPDTQVEPCEYTRFRVAYDALDGSDPGKIQLVYREDSPADVTPPYQKGDAFPYSVTVKDIGNPATMTTMGDVYDSVGPDEIVLVPSTGELIFGTSALNAFTAAKGALNFTYQKSEWVPSDLRPEHYFYCESTNDDNQPVIYNPDYLDNLDVSPDQRIEYQVGFDQTVQVNTYASDVFKHAIGRDVDEIIDLSDQLLEVEALEKKYKEELDNALDGTPAKTEAQQKVDVAKKALTYLRDQLQKRFSNYITHSQGYLDDANEAVTVTGSRAKRVELAENRLSEQQTTFKELASKNEDADATEVAVQLSSAEVSYEAALMATGKMIQTTLLNYL